MVARAYYDSDTDRVISDVPFVFKQPLTVSGTYTMVDSDSNDTIFTINPDAATQWTINRPAGYDGTTFWKFEGGKSAGNASYLVVNGANDGEMGILFGDDQDTADGWVRYDNDAREMRFGAGNNNRIFVDTFGRLGLGASPDTAKMVIYEGVTSLPWSVNSTTEFIVARAGTVGMTLYSSTNNDCRINFADTSGELSVGLINYEHDNNRFRHFVEGSERLRLTTSGADVIGALTKSSGSFRIDHPLTPDTHDLVHSFVEGPQADNIYRGRVTLVDGQATVNLDQAGRMTEGTFVALNGNVQCFTSNESGWTALRGRIEGNTLTIEAQDPTCTDEVSWLVIGERHDQHMIETNWTDENGRVITEPEK